MPARGRVHGRELVWCAQRQGPSQDIIKPSTVMAVCKSSTPAPEAGESEVQGHPLLHREAKTSLSYMELCLYK